MSSYLTDYQYYLNNGTSPTNANVGSYQNISLNDVVDNYMLIFQGEDKIVDNIHRHEVRFHAKQCIKKLNFDAIRSIRVLETTIDSSLKLDMPHDFVDYVRISLESNGVLLTMTENRSAFRADAYLKDNTGELLFDNDGDVLYGSSELEAARIASIEDVEDPNATECFFYRYTFGGRYGLDTSQAKGNPVFRIDRDAGVIDFSSDMNDKLVVIEYVSDGMKRGDDDYIVIHKFFEDYIYKYITYRLLNQKYGVPAVTKNEARKDMHAEWRNARIRMMKLQPATLFMAMRGKSKWFK